MMQDQITGIMRAILSGVGGFALAKGWVNQETWGWIAGGALTIGPAVWSWISNRPAAIAASAQTITGVNVQVSASAPAGVKAAVDEQKN